MTFTHALSTNNYGPAKFIVSSSAANGTHTTIAAALTSASTGDTIFIRPGTYTENLTLKAGVNLTALSIKFIKTCSIL
jgi:pectin methylesterase-like acyl-CoA thioesterase